MILTHKKHIPNISIKINGQNLEQCDSYKYLGIYIDKNLSWKVHVEHVCKKLSKACGALAKTRHYVNVNVLKNIYYALINSYIRYGLFAWGNASFETLKPIRALTNRALRIMSFASIGRLDVQQIYEHFKILDVDNSFLLETGKFIYKYKHELIPSDIIASHFSRSHSTQTIPRYSLRSQTNDRSVVPFELLSSFAQKSIQNRMSVVWNVIPTEIHNCESFSCFKAQYKNYLLLDDS